MRGPGLGGLGLWLHLRGPSRRTTDSPSLPPLTEGQALILHVSEGHQNAAQQIRTRLNATRRDVRILTIGQDGIADPGRDRGAAEALIAAARPGCLLLLGPDLPGALITAAARDGVPVILGEARLDPQDMGWTLRAAMRRELLRRMQTILLTDPGSHEIAREMGLDPARLTMTGPVAAIHEPLPCAESEREAIAQLVRGRHSWLAAAIPENEDEAVLQAHLAALRQSHRALLFWAPRDPRRAGALAERIEAAGLNVARRDQDEDPTDEIHVMLTDGLAEMGLWYRLAPVSYLGGTLHGDDAAARHPFEPAALGSAIVHGPVTGRHPTEWQQLDGAGAARQVANAAGLAAAMAELSQPELIAALARNAWTVSTGGADVTLRICQPVLAALDAAPEGTADRPARATAP
ncbi:MAG: 3-deoxy-D-manno-octulosonic acid transferase [Paracoccus sp.]|uniref:3-deoxy-D-manno-octulosonic acid transferase n=2 Tax=unclassified Paracoccus (in: a-proteobacteria) TaxID=2688777 RepID=UPI000C6075DD|nr:glycosyltransferase N-terminal domain-containing protein [Paracoccus sp. UBA889]MAN56617.1 3-deoxy-D-manno-octulosonic acid transferase [Paracoccus sp. (in: a-proteobacteria)]|tara:strand:- start:294 stop:1511 length:1218 start_codon:yes stop_codon:yes gene_type:complete